MQTQITQSSLELIRFITLIKPGEISVTGNTGTVTQGLQDRYSLDNAIYANNSWRINNKWNLYLWFAHIQHLPVLGEVIITL